MSGFPVVRVACRHVFSRPLQFFTLALALALGSALASFLFLAVSGLQDGLARAVEPFSLLVGAKGSQYQLTTNSIFLQDAPLGNISGDLWHELQKDRRVKTATPLGFGDSYLGCPVVGTDQTVFTIRTGGASSPLWLQVKEGRAFQKPYEALVGAAAAQLTGLKIGDTFKTTHGMTAGGHQHHQVYTVTGIAAPVGGPYDRAIFTPMESIWAAHEGHGEHEGGEDHHDEEAEEAEEAHHDVPTSGDVTAVLIEPKSLGAAYALAQSFIKRNDGQVVFPSQVIVRLFSAMGRSEEILSVVVWSVLAVTTVTSLLILFWSGSSRKNEYTLLRALGLPARTLFAVGWVEGAVTICTGLLTGWIVGRAGLWLLFSSLSQKTALTLTAPLTGYEAGAVAAALLAGVAVSALPALAMGRAPMEKLLGTSSL